MKSRIALIGRLLVAGMIAVLLTVAFYFHGNAVKSEDKAKQLQSDNNLQALTISTQAFNFQRSNEITGAAQQYAVRIIGDSQEKEIEYRTILKTEQTCTLPIPADIAYGLLEYTNRLRASAMPENSSSSYRRSSGTFTTSPLTYCQAVLWINPLLTAIDQANNQLASIRAIETERHEAVQETAK